MKEQLVQMDKNEQLHTSDDGCLRIAFSFRSPGKACMDMERRPMGMRLILGDDAEWRAYPEQAPMANGALIEFDVTKNYLRIITSIVGLPPVFVYQDQEKTVIVSDLHLLLKVRDVHLHFDPEALGDLCQFGHPVAGRTLFREVTKASSGASITFERSHQPVEQSLWSHPPNAGEEARDTYIERLSSLFKKAMAAIDVSRSFLSLTGGLDTRAIFSLLVASKRCVPSYTLSGQKTTLDARIATSLCKSHRLPHSLAILDEGFFSRLEFYVTEASRLSGGLSSLDEAHEVYFYSVIGSTLQARISGNIGNQLCRRGVERISMRNAGTSILNRGLLNVVSQRRAGWFANAKADGASQDLTVLLQHEIPCSSIANYSIGNNFAIQQTPYANRALIEAFAGNPISASKVSSFNLRWRELRHRFIGHSSRSSFQVKVINEVGGAAASCPINWGWTPSGQVSLPGIGQGCLAFLDAASTLLPPQSKLKKGLGKLGIIGWHTYRYPEYWLQTSLKNFLNDTLSTSDAKNSGLFNNGSLNKILSEYYAGNLNHGKDLKLALDLALARSIFNASL